MTIQLKLRITFLCSLFILATGLITASEAPLLPDDIPNIALTEISDATVSPDFVPWCPARSTLCRYNRDWTTEELDKRLGSNYWAVWQDGDSLHYVFHGQADAILVGGGINVDLVPIDNTNYWVANLKIKDLDRAVISYIFAVRTQDKFKFLPESSGVWRGDDAPDQPEHADPLQGMFRTHYIYSTILDEMRLVSIYLPPSYNRDETYPVVYLADGQMLASFARVAEPLMEQQIIPPTILVGVFSATNQTQYQRYEEYVLGVDDDAYIAHEWFFTREVRRWAELGWGVSDNFHDRAVFGLSNGGAFAGNTGVRRPHIYSHVMMFSPSHHPEVTLRSRIDARYYIVSGTLEPIIYETAQRTQLSLLLLGVDAEFHAHVAGHDMIMWQAKFVDALIWMFSE